MQKNTILQLNKINTQFYQTVAEDFDTTRNHYWPGWHTLISTINSSEITSVLDIGCGNGRFGTFSKKFFPHLKKYVGVDNSSKLLEAAKQSNPQDLALFYQVDIIKKLLTFEKILPNKTSHFDLIVLFGVMHHIPSHELRARLLKTARELLSPNGILVFTTWQFMEFERFRKKEVTPEKNFFSKSDLEKNDYFLDWQRGPNAVRYCHYHTQDEALTLLLESKLTLKKKYRADGKEQKVNAYYLATKKD